MALGKFSIIEILDARSGIRFTMPGSGRIRKLKNILREKELFTDVSFSNNDFELDYAYIIPRRILAKSWNNSYRENVFK